jgi:hypothetical protein
MVHAEHQDKLRAAHWYAARRERECVPVRFARPALPLVSFMLLFDSPP